MPRETTNNEVISNISFSAVKSRNFERAVLEVLIENKLTTEEEFETKLKRIYEDNFKSDFADLLKPTEDDNQ